MSKIEEFKNRIVNNGMNEDDFLEFEKLLRRVRDPYLKRQHCYTAAIQFPTDRYLQAIKLIQYGLDQFDDSWYSTYTSYLFMGRIYESVCDYPNAYQAYLSAKNALSSQEEFYIRQISLELLWMKLHIDNFQYSPEVEEYYQNYQMAAGFSQSLINNEFKMTVAKLVIALHHNNSEEAMQSIAHAVKLSSPNYKGKLFDILKKHHFKEELKTTEKANAFLELFKC